MPLGSRLEAETQFRSPQGLEQQKWRRDCKIWSSLWFKAKTNDKDEAYRKGEIEHRNVARQTNENIMRIAQNGFVTVVQGVKILIPAGLF